MFADIPRLFLWTILSSEIDLNQKVKDMDFKDQLKQIADKINKLKDSSKTEEVTKNAFVMPFISALGYDVFNPQEVIPEFTSDMKKIYHAATIEAAEQALKNFEKKMGTQVCIYCQILEKQLGQPDSVLRLSTGNQKDRLYDQYDGKPEPGDP